MKSSAKITACCLFTLLILSNSVLAAAPKKKAHPKKKHHPIEIKETGDFSAVDALVQDQIADESITGAVLLVGHDGNIVHQKAFGYRALSPRRDPMTADTIFDLASLTKVVATAPSVMRLVQFGQLRLDEPVAHFIPEFGVNGKENVTVRQLLTHYSGLRPDVDLNTPWEGHATAFRMANEEKLQTPPGSQFVYSDINFMVLGELVQQMSGMSLDKYAMVHIWGPLGMTHTRFQPPQSWAPKIAETLWIDNHRLLRGVVHDPTAERMGGVAGHAGVFSTAGDLAHYAQALIDRETILTPDAIEKMTTPQQPPNAVEVRGLGWDIDSPFSSNRGSFLPVGSFGHTGFTGTSMWIDPNTNTYIILLTNSVRPRPAASPVVSLRSRVASAVATTLKLDVSAPAREKLLTITGYSEASAGSRHVSTRNGHVLTGIDVLEKDDFAELRAGFNKAKPADGDKSSASDKNSDKSSDDKAKPADSTPTADGASGENPADGPNAATSDKPAESDKAAVANQETAKDKAPEVIKIGLLTNQTGLDATGKRTIDVLNGVPGVKLSIIFSPEHGIFGAVDAMNVGDPNVDTVTGVPVFTLYGNNEAKRRPPQDILKTLDAVVMDIQDAGVRYYTYPATLGYLLEEAAAANVEVIILDRPDPVNGAVVQGPMSTSDFLSFTNYFPVPIRYGMTMGELAQMYNVEKKIGARLRVVPMQGWLRGDWFDSTGIIWTNPSPNLRSVYEASLYTGVAVIESTNISVGRGTNTPFELIGAPWLDARALSDYLNARLIAGVRFVPISFTPTTGPYMNQVCGGVNFIVTDRNVLDGPELGVELASALQKLFPDHWKIDKLNSIVANSSIVEAIGRGDDPRAIAQNWQDNLQKFREMRTKYLLYR